MSINLDFDLASFQSMDQDDLLQRRAGLEEVITVLRGETPSYREAAHLLDKAEEELVRRAAYGKYKPRSKSNRSSTLSQS
ncbi:hypothetical protein RKE25_22635 (plasmid) [Dyella sp. BiH032]|uniref:hypothetical protein n=1 Tax=Dyella sp. BiH032 TaxID=3075430 RepID=UPI0028930075|nr:hypothetical protein [Dyella sp. BiH032]WNL48332.1 hypothetical protein RKE25_22635 [Dyella sp. BiH032]